MINKFTYKAMLYGLEDMTDEEIDHIGYDPEIQCLTEEQAKEIFLYNYGNEIDIMGKMQICFGGIQYNLIENFTEEYKSLSKEEQEEIDKKLINF